MLLTNGISFSERVARSSLLQTVTDLETSSGFTITHEYAATSDGFPAPFPRAGDATFAFDVVGMDVNSTGGLMFEVGGSGVGLYVGYDRSNNLDYNGDLIVRLGDGGQRWQTQTWWGTFDKSIIQGDGTLIVSIYFSANANGSYARVFWNNVEVTPTATSGPTRAGASWGGSDVCSFLHSSTSSIPLGESPTPVDFQSSSVLRFYNSQSVPTNLP